MMMRRLRPTETVETVFDVDVDRLRSQGKTAFIFDFDRTLAPRGARSFPDASRALLDQLVRSGARVGILTNRHASRSIADVPVPILYRAGKPRRAAYLTMLKSLSAEPADAVMIGNRWLTDILGANRLGIYSIRVRKQKRAKRA
jgi:uncharacterized protein